MLATDLPAATTSVLHHVVYHMSASFKGLGLVDLCNNLAINFARSLKLLGALVRSFIPFCFIATGTQHRFSCSVC